MWSVIAIIWSYDYNPSKRVLRTLNIELGQVYKDYDENTEKIKLDVKSDGRRDKISVVVCNIFGYVLVITYVESNTQVYSGKYYSKLEHRVRAGQVWNISFRDFSSEDSDL